MTGIGLVSPLAIGTSATWEALLAGRSGIGPITRFDTAQYLTRIAGEVEGFDPTLYLAKKDVKKADTYIHYGLAAAEFAVADSGLEIDDRNRDRVGVIIGSGIGGLPMIERTHKVLLERGPSRVSPFFIPSEIVNLAAGWVSIRHGARPNGTATVQDTAVRHRYITDFQLPYRLHAGESTPG